MSKYKCLADCHTRLKDFYKDMDVIFSHAEDAQQKTFQDLFDNVHNMVGVIYYQENIEKTMEEKEWDIIFILLESSFDAAEIKACMIKEGMAEKEENNQ